MGILKYAIVKGGRVDNVILAEEQAWIPLADNQACSPGDLWDGKHFSPDPAVVAAQEAAAAQAQAEAEAQAAQSKLQAAAQAELQAAKTAIDAYQSQVKAAQEAGSDPPAPGSEVWLAWNTVSSAGVSRMVAAP